MDIPDPLTPADVKTCYARRGSIEFVLYAFTFMAGESGTCMLLVFQINISGSASPEVSSTNFVRSNVATPGGEYRYFKKSRMTLPRAWVVIVGSVLLYIGTRLLFELSERTTA